MIPVGSPGAALPAKGRKEGRKEHLAKARLQGEARKAPQLQSSEGSEEHEVKGDPRGADERQRTELERRKSSVSLQ